MPQDAPSSGQQESMSTVLAAYLEAVDAGQAPDPKEWVARHPHLADQLRDFLAAQEQVERIAGPLLADGPPLAENSPVSPETMAAGAEPGKGETAGGEPVPERIRYVGDYEVHSEIARGGMGVVYRARQVSLNRLVALKMIRAEQLANPQEVRRFREEAEMAAHLDHPHIVPIYEVGDSQGQHYFSMKLIQGGNLNHFLPRFRNDLKASARLVATAARAVHHAHQRGLLHRDIKPGNLLIDESGQPHITDFGLAKKIAADQGLTLSGAIVGTPEYMSPEQARGDKVLTTGTDVYSLGAVLHVLLTGQPPFQGGSLRELLNRVVEEEPTPPRSRHPGLDRDLDTICLMCLHKDPTRRYGSAQKLAEELESWLQGEPISGRPVGKLERLVKWMKRRPALAGLVATLLLFVLTLAIAGPLIALHQADLRRRSETAQHLAVKREAEADAARKDVERLLIENLLRPLGLREGPPTPLELETLLELAGIPSDSVRLGFLDKGLERAAAQRLGRRADMAMLASVGLNSARRDQALKVLTKKALAQSTPDDTRATFALLVIELESDDPELMRPAAVQVLAALGQPQSPVMLRSLAEKLAMALTPLSPADARPIAKDAVQILRAKMEKTPRLFRNGPMTDALLLLARHMEPKEAAHMLLGEIVQNKGDQGILHKLRDGLYSASAALDPKGAADITQAILTRLAQKQPPETLMCLAGGFGKAAARLEPAEARRRAREATDLILQEMGRSPSKGKAPALVHSWAACLAACLKDVSAPLEARAVAEDWIARIGKTKDQGAQQALGLALEAAVARLTPEDAREMARLLGDRLVNMPEPARWQLVRGLTAAAQKMTREEAAPLLLAELEKHPGRSGAGGLENLTLGLCSVAEKMAPTKKVQVFMKRLAQVDSYGAIFYLAKGLKAAAKDMESREAKQAIELLVQRLSEHHLQASGLSVFGLFKDLAEQLAPDDAAAIAQALVTKLTQAQAAVGKQANPQANLQAVLYLQFLSSGLKDVAGRMSPAEAAPLLCARMHGIREPEALLHLAQGVKAAADGLTPDLARSHCTQVAQALVAAWDQHLFDRGTLGVAEALAALAEHIAPTEAAQLLFNKMTGKGFSPLLAAGLRKVCERLQAQEAREYDGKAAQLCLVKLRQAPDNRFAEGLCAFAQRLPSEEAKPMAEEAAQIFILKMEGKLAYLPDLAKGLTIVADLLGPQAKPYLDKATLLCLDQTSIKDMLHFVHVARALKILAANMEPEDGRRHLQRLQHIIAAKMENAQDPREFDTLTGAFQIVAEGFAPRETAHYLLVATAQTNELEVWIEPRRSSFFHLTQALQKLAAKLSQEDLVDALKHPLCVGQPRTTILHELGRRTGQSFTTLWQFVEWAERQEPTLDLRLPLRRPGWEAVAP